MAKTLKNKYFPNKSFMDVKQSPVASFTWRSILSARGLLQKGLRKVVGHGHSVEIWGDPWVPGLPQFQLGREASHEASGLWVVSELMFQKSWNKPLLQQLFQEWEVAAIMRIPVPQVGGADKWAWHHSKNGELSVRSAYHITLKDRLDAAASSSSVTTGSIWSRLWQSKIPPKVKLFGWRALHNGLAVKKNMVMRGLGDDKRCPLCGEAEESMIHMMVLCAEAKVIWRMSPLRMEVEELRGVPFREWCERKAWPPKEEAWWALFWNLLWGIWLRRNAWLFNQNRIAVQEVILRVVRGSLEYRDAQECSKEDGRTAKGSKVWQRPSGGSYKVNVDAAVFEHGQIGCGGVVRDAMGDVMVACCGTMEGGYEADIAEALAARFVLQLVWEAGFGTLHWRVIASNS